MSKMFTFKTAKVSIFTLAMISAGWLVAAASTDDLWQTQFTEAAPTDAVLAMNIEIEPDGRRTRIAMNIEIEPDGLRVQRA